MKGTKSLYLSGSPWFECAVGTCTGTSRESFTMDDAASDAQTHLAQFLHKLSMDTEGFQFKFDLMILDEFSIYIYIFFHVYIIFVSLGILRIGCVRFLGSWVRSVQVAPTPERTPVSLACSPRASRLACSARRRSKVSSSPSSSALPVWRKQVVDGPVSHFEDQK